MPGGFLEERTPLPPGEHLEEQFNPLIDDFEPKARSYLHFDAPLSAEKARDLTADTTRVISHSFFPFLGFTAIERRYKKVDGKRQIQNKPRDIRYASHTDSAIYEYYASILSKRYESYLKKNALEQVVLAYRSGVGSNIDHAASLFSEIRRKCNCVCIALDISGFFDNIEHSKLKTAWCSILGSDNLPEDHYKIFRSLTCYGWVEKKDLEHRLGRKLRANKNKRLCSVSEFRNKIRGIKPSIIKQNKNSVGIPQGSTMSGLLANIYLYSVDMAILDLCKLHDGSYRRYSDDIAIVISNETDVDQFVTKIRTILSSVKLDINETKTEIVQFEIQNGQQIGNKPFQYLGFTFDGCRTLIRDSSLNRYYRKMTRSLRAARLSAGKKNIPLAQTYLRRHYKTYTHKGKGRNFVRYAYRAAKKLEAPEIRRQLRKHTRIFERKVAEEFKQKGK